MYSQTEIEELRLAHERALAARTAFLNRTIRNQEHDDVQAMIINVELEEAEADYEFAKAHAERPARPEREDFSEYLLEQGA